MNLQAITVTNLIGVTILVVLLISSYLVRQRRQLSDRVFSAMIGITIAACIGETASFWIDGKAFAGARTLSAVISTALFAMNITLSFMWCVYVDLRLYKQKSRLKKYYLRLAIPSAALILALIPNLKFGYLFSIDENNVYHRQPLGYIYFFSVFLYLGLSVVVRYRYYKGSQKAKFFPIWMFIAPIIIGSTIQLFFYGISLVWCSIAIALAGTYMSLQNELSYIDPLTKLYNRNYLDHILSDIASRGAHVGGIMIDIDFFKSINDMYGHSTGDKALINAAEIIRSAKPAKSVAVRFAGDEFIIVSEAENEFELLNIEKSIRNHLSRFNAEDRADYQLSFSIGKSLFGDDSTIDRFLSEMDDNMYSEKRKKHCRSTA
ncbi:MULTISPECIES: GGDEF domain-containing protein [Ruminococcus]|uniref:Diguanylate cyclase (GGDEF) domain-containing protein n=1 Tax=Ruminococcus flavefaciens TaxID=1265 RepID=A0A1M7J5H9_RUMFL|nr:MULTISPECIES: GGDEF domain-containing protein [Ruminococcus]MCR4796219.1 GGDEF domain-containing protein [Ruminococcus sp.]SHM47677.1 diguanylate cyclase (GGDEF) domain-containing protein [Ruminococcus flavefaciens]